MKIFGFIKKTVICRFNNFLSGSTNINSLSCISIKNRECKTRLQVVNVNGDEAVLFPFSIEPSKCSGN